MWWPLLVYSFERRRFGNTCYKVLNGNSFSVGRMDRAEIWNARHGWFLGFWYGISQFLLWKHVEIVLDSKIGCLTIVQKCKWYALQ